MKYRLIAETCYCCRKRTGNLTYDWAADRGGWCDRPSCKEMLWDLQAFERYSTFEGPYYTDTALLDIRKEHVLAKIYYLTNRVEQYIEKIAVPKLLIKSSMNSFKKQLFGSKYNEVSRPVLQSS